MGSRIHAGQTVRARQLRDMPIFGKAAAISTLTRKAFADLHRIPSLTGGRWVLTCSRTGEATEATLPKMLHPRSGPRSLHGAQVRCHHPADTPLKSRDASKRHSAYSPR